MNDYKKQQLATAVKWGVGLLAAGLLAAAIVASAVFLAVPGPMGDGGGPSCEDQGGRHVLSHMSPIFTGKTMIMVPVYRCEEVAP